MTFNTVSTGLWNTSLPSLKASIHALLDILSPQQNVQSAPVSYLKQEKVTRNKIIFQRYQDGDTLAKIADYFGISVQRVHQIIKRRGN